MREGGGGGEYGPPPISPDRKNRTGEMKNWGEKLRPGVSPFSFGLIRASQRYGEYDRLETMGETSDLEGGGLRSPALGILGRLYGTVGSEGEAHGILVGGWTELALFTAINSLPLTANRLSPLAPLSSTPSPFYRRRPSRALSILFRTLLRLIGCGIGRPAASDRCLVPDSSRGRRLLAASLSLSFSS